MDTSGPLLGGGWTGEGFRQRCSGLLVQGDSRLSSWRLSLYSKADGWEYLASGYVRLNQVSGGLNSMIVRAEDGLVKVFVNGARVHSA